MTTLENSPAGTVSREAVVGSRVGLHARPAALFVKAAQAQPAKVTIRMPDGKAVDTRSVLALLALGAKGGDTVILEASGEGAQEAVDALVAVVEIDHDAAP